MKDEGVTGVFSVALAGIDDDGRIDHVNRTLLRLWGFRDELTLIGAPLGHLWSDQQELASIATALADRREWRGGLTARLADGTSRRMMVVFEPTLHAGRATHAFSMTCVDLRTVPLQRAVALFQMLAIADVAVLAVNPAGTIIDANRHASELFGYAPDELIGLPVHRLTPPSARALHAEHLRHFVEDVELERRMGMHAEISGCRKDGSLFPAEATIAKFRGDDGWVLVATLRDISDRKATENELIWRAAHDPLTGLPNRATIQDRLTRTLERSRRQGHSVALLFIDLDGFKLINDTQGHATGDALLEAVALRLTAHVRPGDIVGRLGGDEFVILCDQVEDPIAVTSLANRINAELRIPIEVRGHRLFVTASVGIAIGHGSTHDAEDMLRNADSAMYAAKEQGRDGWRFFSDEIHRQASQRLQITNGLRQAIENNELQVRFQPILSAESRLIRGAELLLRWYPAGGEVSPVDFIPIAEESGSILTLGKWVFHQACLASVQWRELLGGQAPSISVNVSARQLADLSLVESCARMLQETGADPADIILELTETSLMKDPESDLGVLHQLAGLGLRIAVDDFGTGHSSLAQLLRLPISTLKIDREFVDGLDKLHESRAIVSAVCSMARAMNLQVIAEGVENDRQFGYLRDIGCDYVQGFHFSRPLPPAEFIDLLRERGEGGRIEAPSDLYALLYVSLATWPMTRDDLQHLLERSRAANRARGITGFLLYLNGSFMQLIEGSEPRIRDLIRRIRADQRHHDLRVVFEGPIDKRTFIDWSMGFRDMEHGPQGHDLADWPGGELNFFDLADDARACRSLISAFAH